MLRTFRAPTRPGGGDKQERNLMLRSARPADRARTAGASWTAAAVALLAGPVLRRKKSVMFVGVALALASAGSASAATVDGPEPGQPAVAARHGALLTAGRAQRAARQHSALLTVALLPGRSLAQAVGQQSNPSRPASPADQLMPVGTTGSQLWMPISGAQLANASTIVQQALAKNMGARSAVIAVATAMQESRLLNLGYGSAGSLGLFQQRPSCGWGTAQQITTPAYAADAFLAALQRHQAADPVWASQPLWANAEAVQASGFPLAYAQWEAQAAQLVHQIAPSLA